ncbi:MAG: PfkB family carbohydrate kinase [Chloroflexota bacterium]
MSQTPLDYLVVGHITVDHTPIGTEFGGTALFAAITAHQLGARVHVLTSMPESTPDLIIPSDIEVRNIPSAVWCTFRHEYENGEREQYVTAVAKTLHASDLPPRWRDIPVVHFGPLVQEVDHELMASFDHSLLGASVQGWLRRWDQATGHVTPVDPAQMLAWAPPVHISFLSEEDIGDQRGVIDLYRKTHKIVVLTDGSHGATVYEDARATHVRAFPVAEVDSNGAGDVFSAAFLIRYHETEDAVDAARFAAVVASYHVEQVGTEGIPTREQAEARLREYARL